ncbi:hypothetical protein [uncultured Campylobacter sp.]|nr:hypothetical protein [uncultured Campylobacter sp.]
MEFKIYSLCGAAIQVHRLAAERKILTAHEILMARGILKFKDASAR